MLPRSGRMVDDNIDTDTDTDTVATDLHRTSSCVALALPLPFPYYYEYYYYYYYPRATRIAASLLNSDRPTLTGHHEEDDYLLSLLARIDEPQVEPKCFDLAARSTKIQPKEQQDEREAHGEQETENVASFTNDEEVTVLANVNSNRFDRHRSCTCKRCNPSPFSDVQSQITRYGEVLKWRGQALKGFGCFAVLLFSLLNGLVNALEVIQSNVGKQIYKLCFTHTEYARRYGLQTKTQSIFASELPQLSPSFPVLFVAGDPQQVESEVGGILSFTSLPCGVREEYREEHETIYTLKKARFVCEEDTFRVGERGNDSDILRLRVALIAEFPRTIELTSSREFYRFRGNKACEASQNETNDMNTGLLVEVWCKGFLWDRFLGYYYVPLSEVSYMNEVTSKQSYNTSTGTVSTGKQEQQHISTDSMRDTNSNTQPPDTANTMIFQRATYDNEIIGIHECPWEFQLFNLQDTGAPPRSLSLLGYQIDRKSLWYGDLASSEELRTSSGPHWPLVCLGLGISLASRVNEGKTKIKKKKINPDEEYTAEIGRLREGSGQWVSLDSELEMRGAEIIGTKKPTGHSLLIDCRLELPFAGYSEDSDYTSDLNYPVGGQGANSSASQFRTAANQLATPQRSLETSRENSYERDDHQIPATVGGRLAPSNYGGYGGSGHSPRYDEPYPEEGPPQRYSQSQHASESSEPLFYNSRPRHYKEYRRRKHTWDYEDSQDGWYSEGYDYHGTRVDETRIYSDTEYYPSTTTSTSRRRGPYRRPSLERQMTLYDDHSYYTDGYSSDGRVGKMSATYPECQTDIRYNEYYDSTTGYGYQDERYGQDDEDRQWDSGGKWYLGTSTYYENKRNRKTLPQRPASSIGIHRPDYRPTVTRQRSYESEELNYSGHSTRRRKPLQPQQRPPSRTEGTGKKLPPTPTKPSNVIINRKLASLPATPSRQLPKTRTPSEESYYKSDYNEDYNYAYRSQDNLPQDTYIDSIYSEQSGYDQMHAPGKTQYAEDSQYGSSYTPQVDDQYTRSYQEPQTQDTYDQSYLQNSYKDEYQKPYVQQNAQVYQDTYQDVTYPNASQPNDQYTSQPNDQYRKTSRDMIIDDNYQVMGYDQNNVQYQDRKTMPAYKEDTYQEQYDGYNVSVPSSVYDQNNKTYPETQDTYNQDTYNQAPITSQGNYEDTYSKPQKEYVDYQTPYSKEDTVNAAYKNDYQDQYQEPYDQYEESYPDSYQGSFEERYKESPVASTERRTSEVPELSVTTPRGQTRANGYQSSESDYYFTSQESQDVSSTGAPRRKKLEKREPSPLVQQHTDSLESKDDELKESIETAVSSISSIPQKKGSINEYPSVADSSAVAPALIESPQSTAQPATTMVNHVTANHVPASMTVTAMVHTAANGKRLTRTESYQEDVIEDEEYPEIIPTEPQRKDSQLSHQSQLSQHSSQHSQHSQKPKLTRGDSYASDHFPEESYSRRGSYAQSTRKDSFSSATQETFKPPLTRTDSYQKRGSYGQNFGAPQPISRAESYQRGYFKDQESIEEPEVSLSNAVNDDYKMRDESLERYERGDEAMLRDSREDSLVDTYKTTPPMSHTDSPRGSITKQASLEESVQMDTPPRSPPEPPPDKELLEMVGAAPVPTQLKERPEMTARQRWHWAYNQIVMQLRYQLSPITISSVLIARFLEEISND
ncbi:Phorbol ester/diacylglycerol-binding protein unc-13 [Melipona quadrifasciata]|uniref:Phorbol ester/diacylglycerol-binding protein unc-13 n=1 Tax=Melipona quadrifasciata TaxID=166423 RepID=A0A0N1ITS9_9HYME|nr:Phorbol ester/diacylglycerol-binding protein unc-13 [Melipona quadrifasciata]